MMELKRFALAMVGHFLSSLLYVLQRLHIVNAVVDTTSILEHREELRDLWEKRMMADDNQSSPSSAVEEKTKPSEEGIKEGEVTNANQQNAKLQPNHLTNGHAKSLQENGQENDTNANHIDEVQSKPTAQVSETIALVEEDHENNNSADSLEVDNNNEVFVEEKTYTSQLETSLVVKQVTEVTAASKEYHIEETIHNEPVSDETVTTTDHETDGQTSASASLETEASFALVPHEGESLMKDEPSTVDAVKADQIDAKLAEAVADTKGQVEEKRNEIAESDIVAESVAICTMKALDIPTPTDEEGDGFVPLAQCLPQEDGEEVFEDSTQKDASEDVKVVTTNGFGEHSSPSPVTSTPEPLEDEKPSHPEMETFVKSGGVKRILPGVQKTEQPYSSCTTETKIAMEIREMREREEELRIMREQSLLSPSPVMSPVPPSPVPPKSPCGRSPSPSIKDGASPTPAGPGYKVSSVFGHRGTISPSPPIVEEEKKLFKLAAKESPVEKEIRLARDREEELRKQKGLPPREDDSYVKPSQVKSSQVRIFGKAAGNASVKQAATAKIQMEIEEQTQREMALRETGSIQTISQERTDAKVAKLKTPECTTPPLLNGNTHSPTNGNFTNGNGRHSPDVAPYKRSSPSPTGITGRPASIFSHTNGNKSISMQKFIASKGKETSFNGTRNGGPFVLPKEEKAAVIPPTMVKLKRNVSVESKIQQEIMEMKQREEELKKIHMNKSDENTNGVENGRDHEMNQKNNSADYENGNGINEDDISPRHNKLIAQWEQRIQKAES